MESNDFLTLEQAEARYDILFKRRERWLKLMNDHVRMRRLGGLQSQMDRAERKSVAAKNAIVEFLKNWHSQTRYVQSAHTHLLAFATDNDAKRADDCKRLVAHIAILGRVINHHDDRAHYIEMANESYNAFPIYLAEQIQAAEEALDK